MADYYGYDPRAFKTDWSWIGQLGAQLGNIAGAVAQLQIDSKKLNEMRNMGMDIAVQEAEELGIDPNTSRKMYNKYVLPREKGENIEKATARMVQGGRQWRQWLERQATQQKELL